MSATCDIWACKHRSYMAVNVTFIDPTTFESASILIAIDRFEGSHTNDAVAAKLKGIFKRFKIYGKVVGVTTDNAGEFVAAFVKYGDNYVSYEPYLYDREEEIAMNDSARELETLRNEAVTHIISDDDDLPIGMIYDSDSSSDSDCLIVDDSLPPIIVEAIDSSSSFHTYGLANQFDQSTSIGTNTSMNDGDEGTGTEIDFQVLPIESIDFRSSEDDDDNILLPIRIKCGPHTLNLLGKTDAVKALTDSAYAAIYCRVMSKLNLLWKYCGQRKACETIKHYLGKVLLRPHKIRWNALYDSVREKFSLLLTIIFCS